MTARTSQAALASKTPDRRYARGPVIQVGEDLLHDGVVTVLPLGLDELGRRAGEDGVVAPGGEQLILALRLLLVPAADAADDQPRGDLLLVLLRGERRVLDLGDLGGGDPAVQLVVPDGLQVLDGGPGIPADVGDRRADSSGQ
jgi:hypothetical protein